MMVPRRFNAPFLAPTGTYRNGRPEFTLERDFIWWLYYKRSGLCFFGPKGFVTDKLSIPRPAVLMGCRPNGVGWEASLPHDLGYSGAPILRVDLKTGCVLETYAPSRAVVDCVFREALPICGAGAFRARVFYNLVDLFAGPAWARPDDPDLTSPPDKIPMELLAA